MGGALSAPTMIAMLEGCKSNTATEAATSFALSTDYKGLVVCRCTGIWLHGDRVPIVLQVAEKCGPFECHDRRLSHTGLRDSVGISSIERVGDHLNLDWWTNGPSWYFIGQYVTKVFASPS